MILPRWSIWPALAVLAFFVAAAVPRRVVDPNAGAALAARAGDPEARVQPVGARNTEQITSAEEPHKRVIVLGIDGLDPELLAETVRLFPERMPNFRKLIAEGDGIQSLGTSIPPQSPVAWSNFITGLDPGGHGIFDFIHRDLVTRGPAASTVKVGHADNLGLFGDWKLPLGGDSPSNRSGEAFWVTLAKHGVAADVWRMPINFPVEPALGLSFPGMMTPALDSAYGMYTIFTSDPPVKTKTSGGTYRAVREFDGVIDTFITGPPNPFKVGDPAAQVALTIYVDHESQSVAIDTGADVIVMEPGEWSDFAHLDFDMLPMGVMGVRGVVRFYLRSIEPVLELYASPVNIDPEAPAMPVSEPDTASADLAELIGVYYTQGMAEEVNALKDDALTDQEFMQQAELVYDERVRMMDAAIDHYIDDAEGGFLFFYYSTVDLCCHMVWRLSDEGHPQFEQVKGLAAEDSSAWSGREGSTWKDVVHDLYMKMDPILGRLRERVGEEALIFVMSDHGFAPYSRKFSLNRWLHEEGFLVLKEGREPELLKSDPEYAQVFIMDAVDWSKTRAYGMGFNGLYLNLAGRELDNEATPEDESGIVQAGEARALVEELKVKLEAIRDPLDGTQVVLSADITADVYAGDRVAEAPDIQVGFNYGYGNSDASSTGRVPYAILEDNLGGTFNGNHLMAAEVVAGTLLTNAPVAAGAHSLKDLTVEILRQYGITPRSDQTGHPVLR
jgi:predicted AlkP superfamily phosphohydrolase/phosphomutase